MDKLIKHDKLEICSMSGSSFDHFLIVRGIFRMTDNFPDPNICRVRTYRKHVWECKAVGSSCCPYALSIAEHNFCTHLRCSEFGRDENEKLERSSVLEQAVINRNEVMI